MSYLGNVWAAIRGKSAPLVARPLPIAGKRSVTWNGDRGWRPVAPIWSAGDGAYSSNDERALAQVYSKLDIVQACVNELAQSILSAPLVVCQGEGEDRVDSPDHPALDLFYDNPTYSYAELWRLIIARLFLTGASFNLLGLYKDIMGAGTFTPLPTHLVKRNMRGPQVLGYEFDRGEADPLKLKPEEVCTILFPDPQNFGGYVSPLQAACRAVNTDQQRADTTWEVLKNQTIPGGFLQFEKGQAASKSQLEQLKDSFERATGAEVANRGRVAALPPGVQFAPGISPKDVDLSALATMSETRICMVFQVPPILIGAKSGLERSTFANYEEARKSFYAETIRPLWTYLAEGISRSSILGDSGEYFRFDDSAVKELSEDRSLQFDRATKAYSAGLLTRNEARAEMGLDPTTDGGDEFKAPAPSPFGMPGEEEREEIDGKCSCEGFHGKARPAIGSFKGSRPLTEALRRFFNEQNAAVQAAVMNGKLDGFKSFCREWDQRLIDMTRPTIRQLWEAEVRGKLYKVNAAFVNSPAGKSMKLQGKAMPVVTGAFDVIRKEALELLDSQMHAYAKSINETTGEALDAAISNVVITMQKENTIPALTEAVKGVFKDASESRARMIAITESSRATHDGAVLAATRSGVVKRFEFLASPDCCDICQELNGKKVSLAEAEAELGEYDRQLPPVHPNCRCTLLEDLLTPEELEEAINAAS